MYRKHENCGRTSITTDRANCEVPEPEETGRSPAFFAAGVLSALLAFPLYCMLFLMFTCRPTQLKKVPSDCAGPPEETSTVRSKISFTPKPFLSSGTYTPPNLVGVSWRSVVTDASSPNELLNCSFRPRYRFMR